MSCDDDLVALRARVACLEELLEVQEQVVSEQSQTLAAEREEIEASRERYRTLLETTKAVPWQWDVRARRLTYVGPQGAELLGCAPQDWLEPGFIDRRMHPEDHAYVMQEIARGVDAGQDFEFRLKRNDGAWLWVRCSVSVTSGGESPIRSGLIFDITERRRLELDLQQAQKLESVGRLAAGVAHEINTPIQFVSDNVQFLLDAHAELLPILAKYRALRESAAAALSARQVAEIVAAEARADVPFLVEQMPKALQASLEGLERVAVIVRAMKEFAHPEATEMAPADLNHALETTLAIARNEYRYVADVRTSFSSIPAVRCNVGELNQVFLNLIVNAAHAIAQTTQGTDRRGVIDVVTRREEKCIAVSIADSGTGIPEGIREKIFDPFFTTKEVGKGTGQGLAIARAIVKNHGGTISFETEIGHGTTFVIRLPVDVPSDQPAMGHEIARAS